MNHATMPLEEIERALTRSVEVIYFADDRKRREPGCRCHLEEGDSPCPIHDAEGEVP